MRIGVDGACLSNRRGFGRFARQLLGALAETPSGHDFCVFVDRPSAAAASVPEPFERVIVDLREAPSQAASATGRRRLRDMLAMGRAVARHGLDLMFFPASYTFFPVWNVKRVVVTMHDTLALTHPELVFPTWQGRMAWKLKEHAAVRQADRILTVSETARRDLLAWFALSPECVTVVTEGPGAAFRPLDDPAESRECLARYGIQAPRRYLLYVGGLSPHKNLPRLIEAFARVATPELLLVLVGDLADRFHTHVPLLREAVAQWGLAGRVVFTGFVHDDDLVHLYNHAHALVQPSLMEGFGLPPVEAMACGTPVVSSTAGSLPEVVGEAGLYFDPTDVGSISAALGQILADQPLRDRLACLALARSKRFTWSASARSALACFEELAETLGRRKTA